MALHQLNEVAIFGEHNRIVGLGCREDLIIAGIP